MEKEAGVKNSRLLHIKEMPTAQYKYTSSKLKGWKETLMLICFLTLESLFQESMEK